MEFLRLIRSLEELLYEVMAWLVFYPLTLWRALRHPLALATQADAEFDRPPEERYADLMSPPLFLMLSVLVAHGVEIALHATPAVIGSALEAEVPSSDRNILIFRSLVFALFPLLAAVGVLRRRRVTLTRTSLKRPFYVQCFFAGPFAVLSSAGATVADTASGSVALGGIALATMTVAWYLGAEWAWVRHRLDASRGRAAVVTLEIFLLPATATVIIALLVFGALPDTSG